MKHVEGALMLMLCGATLAAHAQSGPAVQARYQLKGRFVQIGGVPPADNSPLLNPVWLGLGRDVVYLMDAGDYTLKGVSLTGKFLWSMGRKGSGPHEFSVPSDLQVDANGIAWVCDGTNVRITGIGPDGKVVATWTQSTVLRRAIPVAVRDPLE